MVGFMTSYLDQALAVGDTVIRAESDNDWGNLGFICLLAGPVFFWIKYLKYRNTDKRHQHESETKAEMANVQAGDQFVKSMKGLRNSRMPRANSTSVRGARNGSKLPFNVPKIPFIGK